MQEKFQMARFWHFYSLQLKCFKMFTAKKSLPYEGLSSGQNGGDGL
jgi:hypothetical protein